MMLGLAFALCDRIYLAARRMTVDAPVNLPRPSGTFLGCLSNDELDRRS